MSKHVSIPTRNVLNQTPHILDLVLTKNEDIISDLDLLPPLGSSDHNLIFMKTTINSDKKEIAEKLCYRKADFTKMSEIIEDSKVYETNLNKNVEEQWDSIKSVLPRGYFKVHTQNKNQTKAKMDGYKYP